jgi:hypothetical protein
MESIFFRLHLARLSEEQVAAIGEHEHIPEIAAAVLANYLLHQPHGATTIDDIHKALDDRRVKRAADMALRHLLEQNPEERTGFAVE